jgi:enoyl-CoA hydratase
MIPTAHITACALGGRGVQDDAVGPPLLFVAPAAIDAFAERHAKALRYLNRGAVVTAALLDALLEARWPEARDRPQNVALIVGTAFGNQGETTRFFDAIHAGGAGNVAPMASYDVAVNSFVSFAAIFFGLRGVVHTLSSGAASGLDALVSACCVLEASAPDAVLVVGFEPDAAEAFAYSGGPTPPPPGLAEAGAVLLLEKATDAAPACGRVLAADVAFAPRASGTARVLGEVLTRLLPSDGPRPGTVFAGPPWSDSVALTEWLLPTAGAEWISGGDVVTPWAVGAHGLIGAALVMRRLAHAPERGPGLVITVDPDGWLGALLLGPPGAAGSVNGCSTEKGETPMSSQSLAVSAASTRHAQDGRSDATHVRVAVEDGVAVFSLDRPPTNALIGPMLDELVTGLRAVADDPAVGALVITGAIRNSFCSGGDLEALFSDFMQQAHELELLGLFEHMQLAYRMIEDFPKPTVAAINGVAIGAGLELALVCDFRVASDLSYFALPELAHRIIPGLGGTQRLARVIGLGRAKEILMLGRRLRAEEALAWGLVHRLAPHRQTLAHALRLARDLARKPPDAFATLKRTIHRGLQVGPDIGLSEETREFVALLRRRFASVDQECAS